MARKSFKKGVKSVIDSIDNTTKKKLPAKEPTKITPKATKSKATSNSKVSKPPVKKSMEFNLGSKFSVQEVNTGMTALKEALKQTEKFVIKSDVVTELDVSYMQMLIAFDKAAKEKKLDITYDIKVSDEITKIMKNSGLCDVLNPFFNKPQEELQADD